ncbi:MAG: DUF4367 domain-containing protein [Anaerocolumna sp.]
MPESNEKKHQNYSIFDSMSTEELENILQADAQLLSEEDSDTDAILYIMEVIAKRENEHPTGRFTDVQVAWTSFEHNYLPYIENDKSIYEFEDSDIDITQKPLKEFFSLQRKHRMIRFACTAAIFVAVLLAGNMTAKAFGIDLFGTVAMWTKDTFSFSSSVPHETTSDVQGSSEATKTLQNILEEYGITSDLIPTWLPDGYSFKSNDIYETPARTSFYAIYNCEEGEISVKITSLSKPVRSIIEKDNNEVTVYSVNGIEHYIMTNLKITNVVWTNGTYEGSISGNFSLEEAKKMIDSIYKRK